MSEPKLSVRATTLALMVAGMAAAQATVGATDQESMSFPAAANAISVPGQVRGAEKFAAPFTTLAGSRENAIALATALRNSSNATLTYTSTAADGTTTTTTTEITTPTKPMGWGNVSHSLALARFALNQEGISKPTGAQLRAALDGGTLTTADGRSVTLAGVLQQRADGMGFGRIAHSYGTTMGAVNRGIKASATSDVMTTTAAGSNSPSVTAPRVASAPSVAAGRGLTTAAGTATSAGQGARGLTTASGATSRGNPHGVVTANGGTHGNGNAYGRGIVTASGSSAGIASSGGATRGASNGVVTGAGRAGHVVTADAGRGGGSGNGHGKGKSG